MHPVAQHLLHWPTLLTCCGLAAYLLANRHPRLGWAVAIAAQPAWAIYGLHTGAWSFAISAPVYAVAFSRLLIRDTRTRSTPPVRTAAPCNTCALYIFTQYEREQLLATADRH